MDISPEALRQRMTGRAVAFLQEILTGETIGNAEIFASFTAVHIADSTGFTLAPALKELLRRR
jgi:hypothetical protein